MSWTVTEYVCKFGHRTESIDDIGDRMDSISCGVCGQLAERIVSAGHRKIPYASVSTGKNGSAPTHALDTRPLADGMSREEWRRRGCR